MPDYLLQLLDSASSHVLSWQGTFADDFAAIEKAKGWACERAVEVWRGPNRIWRRGDCHLDFSTDAARLACDAMQRGDLEAASTWLALAAEGANRAD